MDITRTFRADRIRGQRGYARNSLRPGPPNTAVDIRESTMRAAVADLVPAARRGTGCVFTAIYGISWLAGSSVIDMLCDRSVPEVIEFTITTQIAALNLFIPLATRR